VARTPRGGGASDFGRAQLERAEVLGSDSPEQNRGWADGYGSV
jgi:hypothetical protein